MYDGLLATSFQHKIMLRQQLLKMLPPDPLSEIRRKLAEAIEEEDYEEAARLRDSLSKDEGRNEAS